MKRLYTTSYDGGCPLGLWRNTLPATWARATSLRFGIVASPCIHWSSEDAGTPSCLANSSRPIRPTTLRRSSCWCVSNKGRGQSRGKRPRRAERQAGRGRRQARLRPMEKGKRSAAGASFATQAACPPALERKRSRFILQLDDPKKDLGRGAAFPREPTVEIVDADVEGQNEVRVAVVVDHVGDGSYVKISVSHHNRRVRKCCAFKRRVGLNSAAQRPGGLTQQFPRGWR